MCYALSHCAIDQHWLDSLNNERKAKDLGSVPYEVFEIVMDRLEKEWFDLVRNDYAFVSRSLIVLCSDQEHPETRPCDAIGRLNLCYM